MPRKPRGRALPSRHRSRRDPAGKSGDPGRTRRGCRGRQVGQNCSAPSFHCGFVALAQHCRTRGRGRPVAWQAAGRRAIKAPRSHHALMRILFVTATRIGDAVLSTALLSHLITRFPEARLTIAAGPAAAPLFAAVPGLERLIIVQKQRWALHWPALYARTAGHRWEIVVDLRGSALAWLLWARGRFVIGRGDPWEHWGRQLGRLLGLVPPPSPVVWTSPAHDRAAEALGPPGSPVLAIGPAANWRGKQWRAERFAELAQRLTAGEGPLAGARVAVLAASHERRQAKPLLAAIPRDRQIDLVGKVDLLTAVAILPRCAMFIGN